MRTATAQEIVEAAAGHAVSDAAKGVCDPDGRWHSWISINGLWNSYSSETSRTARQELPLAYPRFVRAYLEAQGWRKP